MLFQLRFIDATVGGIVTPHIYVPLSVVWTDLDNKCPSKVLPGASIPVYITYYTSLNLHVFLCICLYSISNINTIVQFYKTEFFVFDFSEYGSDFFLYFSNYSDTPFNVNVS